MMNVRKTEVRLDDCKVCKGQIASTAEVCPHCGARLKPPPTVVFLVFVIVMLVFIIFVSQL